MTAAECIASRTDLCSRHIDEAVQWLKENEETCKVAADTLFLSAGLPYVDRPVVSKARTTPTTRFACLFHCHHLRGTSGNHWTMSWVQFEKRTVYHFDSLWEDQGGESVDEASQADRHCREKAAREVVRRWTEDVWAHVDGGYRHYLTGRKTMQQDTWTCVLQVLETLRFILKGGGDQDLLRVQGNQHTLTKEAIEEWKKRLEPKAGSEAVESVAETG